MTRWEIRVAGSGGQGAITAGHIVGEAASLFDRKEAIMTEDYSPYVTGGWSRADVIISDESIDYPLILNPDALIAMSQESLDTHWQYVKEGGLVLVERSIVDPAKVQGRQLLAVPGIAIAEELGRRVIANIVLLGAFTAATGIVSPDAMKQALAKRFPKAAELNRVAFDRGFALVQKEVKA